MTTRAVRRALAWLQGASGYAEAVCPEGCGCRIGTEDADRLECGCDGPCTGEAWSPYPAEDR